VLNALFLFTGNGLKEENMGISDIEKDALKPSPIKRPVLSGSIHDRVRDEGMGSISGSKYYRPSDSSKSFGLETGKLVCERVCATLKAIFLGEVDKYREEHRLDFDSGGFMGGFKRWEKLRGFKR
jgi:hypothetical protein